MTTDTLDGHSPPRDEPRYAALSVAEATVIYDRDNHRAWVQSDDAVPLEEAT